MKESEKICRNCKYFEIEIAKDAAGRVRKNVAVKCLWPVPVFPISVWQSIPSPGYTTSERGLDCACFEERK